MYFSTQGPAHHLCVAHTQTGPSSLHTVAFEWLAGSTKVPAQVVPALPAFSHFSALTLLAKCWEKELSLPILTRMLLGNNRNMNTFFVLSLFFVIMGHCVTGLDVPIYRHFFF